VDGEIAASARRVTERLRRRTRCASMRACPPGETLPGLSRRRHQPDRLDRINRVSCGAD
jgi:hypothetical protein